MPIKVFILMLCLIQLSFAGIEDVLYDDTMLRVEGEIKETVKRQGIIAHNIANADVDGYQPIRFADELEELKLRPDFTEDKVVVEEEMAKMTKNRMRHQAFLKIYNIKMQALRSVITQGK